MGNDQRALAVVHTRIGSESYDRRPETLWVEENTDEMSVGAWGKARGNRSLQRGTEQNDRISQSHPVTTQFFAQPCDTIPSAFQSPITGNTDLFYFMADYKPVQGVSDDAVELAGEQSRPENTFIESPKIGTKESETANVQHRASATPSSSIINLANTVLGTGMLAMVSKRLVCDYFMGTNVESLSNFM